MLTRATTVVFIGLSLLAVPLTALAEYAASPGLFTVKLIESEKEFTVPMTVGSSGYGNISQLGLTYSFQQPPAATQSADLWMNAFVTLKNNGSSDVSIKVAFSKDSSAYLIEPDFMNYVSLTAVFPAQGGYVKWSDPAESALVALADFGEPTQNLIETIFGALNLKSSGSGTMSTFQLLNKVDGPNIFASFSHHDNFIISPGSTIKITMTSKAFNAQISCPGDLDIDGSVGPADITILTSSWGWTGVPGGTPADLNGDGKVDAIDLSVLLNNWGACGL